MSSPAAGDRVVVFGRIEPSDYGDDGFVVDGQSAPLAPDEFAAWIQEQPEYAAGVPVVLLADDAHWFAFAVAPILGATVTGPGGDVLSLPTGDLVAGTLRREPDGGLRIDDAPNDGWYTYGPDGDLTGRVRTLPDSGAFLRDQAIAATATGRPVGIWRSTAGPKNAGESPAMTSGMPAGSAAEPHAGQAGAPSPGPADGGAAAQRGHGLAHDHLPVGGPSAVTPRVEKVVGESTTPERPSSTEKQATSGAGGGTARRLDPDHAWNRLLDPAISAERRQEALDQAAKLVEERIRQVRPGENPRGAVSRPDEVVVLVAAEYLRGPRSAGALTNLLISDGARPRPTVVGPAQHAGADDVAAPLTEAVPEPQSKPVADAPESVAGPGGAPARATAPRPAVEVPDIAIVPPDDERGAGERGTPTVRITGTAAGERPDPRDEPAPAATAPPRLPIEDVLDQTRAIDVDGRPVAVLLPGAPEEAAPDALIARMRDLAGALPESGVFVFGTVRDGRVMAGEQEIPVEAVAAAIDHRAFGLIPHLRIDGGASLAEPLSKLLNRPVRDGLVSEVEAGPEADQGPTPSTSVMPESEGRPLEPSPAAAALSAEDVPPPVPPSPPGSTPPSAEPPVVEPIADPMVRSIGVPRAALPQMPALLRRIRQALDEAGVNHTENELTLLTQRLLANYRYLGMHDAAGETGDSGLQVPIGDGEVLVTLDATDPYEERNPAGATLTPSGLPPVEGGHQAVGTINSVFATGAHAQSQSGQLGATRGALSASLGVPVAPGVIVRGGVSISGTANQSNRSDTHIADAEGGHVEDNRTAHKLIAYTAKWSFKVRTDDEQSWARTPVQRLDDPTDERLFLWIPDHYLEKSPADQVIATGEAVKVDKLPSYFSASGLTNLPRLFDEIAAVLREKGLPLPMGSSIRQELLQKLWNLDMHLDAAVNTARGYRFRLHSEHGRPMAAVSVRSERLAGAPRVGATSDKSHIENVRTAIDGWSGGHTIGNASALTFPSAEVDLGAPVTGLEKAGLGIAGYLSYSSSNTDGISAGRTGLHVLVPRDTSYTNAYDMSFTHRATVSVRGDEDRRAPKTTGPVPGRALVRVPEAAAYEHGLPVDREALKNPPAQGGTVPYEPNAIRGTGRGPNDPDTKPVPHYVAEGKGVGMGLVMVAEGTVEEIRNALTAELSGTGFLPADGDDPFEGYTWYGHGNRLDSLVDSEELFDKMVSSRGLDSHYDQIHQDGMTFTLRKRRGGMGVDLDVDSAKVTIKARKNPAHEPEFIRSTDQFHTVNLAMGMDSAGASVGHSRKVAAGFKFKGLFQSLKTAMMGVEFQRSVGASDAVGFLNNRPELLEYPGKVDEFALTSDYEITVEYQHSGVQGRVRKSVRDPDPITVENQTALAYLLPLGTEEGPISEGPTPAEVLEQGVVYFVDTTGVRGAVTALGRMTDPAGTASAARDT
ncbi:hypothetical protein AB0L00_39620, partial [Actinoallomurus sp. NPDC052308]